MKKPYVVEDEVDTGELLESLDTESGESAETVSVLTLEAVEVRRRSERASVVNLRSDFSVLLGDLGRVDIDTEDASESDLSLLVLAGSDEVTGRFGEESESSGEDDGPRELDTDRDSVRAEIVAARSFQNVRSEETGNLRMQAATYRSLVALTTTAAMRRPIVIIHCGARRKSVFAGPRPVERQK